MPGRAAWEGDTQVSALLVAESEPDHDGSPGLADRHQGGFAGGVGDSYRVPADLR